MTEHEKELNKLRDRIELLEADLEAAEDRAYELEKDLDSTEDRLATAEEKNGDLEQVLQDLHDYFLELAPEAQLPYIRQRIVDFVKERR